MIILKTFFNNSNRGAFGIVVMDKADLDLCSRLIQTNCHILPTPITDINIQLNDNCIDSCEKIIYKDLNKGAGGDDIYPCYSYKKGQDPITGIQIIHGSSFDISAPAGYTKINIDLNRGAEGEYIYLCYTRNKNLTPITDLFVTFDQETAPDCFQKIDVDLNKGAGGKFVYLWYKRDGATFFQDANYTGNSTIGITEGSYTLSQLQAKGFVNDWTSSVMLPDNRYVVELYENDNFQGNKWVLGQMDNNSANFNNFGGNDKISSIKVLRKGIYNIVNVNSGKYLDVYHSGSDGTNVQQFSFNDTNAQKWGNYL